MGLVDTAQYAEMFTRYVQHVTANVRGEKVKNIVTGKSEAPPENIMKELEAAIKIKEDPNEFRNDLIRKIGAWRIENPEGEVDYHEIFPEYFSALEENYFEKRKMTILKNKENMVKFFENEKTLSSEEKTQVETTLKALKGEYGYNDESAKSTINFLLKHRYEG